MENLETKIHRLKAAIEKKDAKFQKAREQIRNLEDTRKALFNIMGEMEKAEEALRTSEERYRGIVANIGTGIAMISPNMEVLSLNKQLKKWFPDIDTSKRPICHKAFNNPPREEICPYCPTSKTLQDGQVHESITETPAGREIRNYRIISSPIKDKEDKTTAAIEMVEDITDRIRAEKALREETEITKNLLMIAAATVHITDMDRLMEEIVHCIRKIMKCEISLFYLWDAEKKVLKPGSACGLTYELIP
ncbi:MAG: hypothetical protein HZB37_10370 [Planctomycetes bacterium]|nr:hypothetical protein [Planctomycetota bacterium]